MLYLVIAAALQGSLPASALGVEKRVRVLLLEPDPKIRALVRRCLEPEGHEVFALANADQALAVLRSRPADLIICAIEPGNSEGGAFLKGARGQAGAAVALLMSAFHSADDPELTTAMSAFARADFLQKKFEEAELTERLRGLIRGPQRAPPSAPRPARAPPPTTVLPDRQASPTLASRPARPVASSTPSAAPARGPLDLNNVRLVARLWLTRAVGTLCLNGSPSGRDGWASLNGGGPADEESRGIIEAGLGGGELTFEAVEILAPGDWEGLGQLLWRAVYDPTQRSFVAENRFQALTRTPGTAAAAHLPLHALTRRVLALADGHQPLGEVAARESVDVGLVSAELYALVQLRLVTLQTPIAAPSRRPEPTQERPPSYTSGVSGVSGASGVASLGADRVPRSPVTATSDGSRSTARPAVPPRPHSPTLDSRTDMRGASARGPGASQATSMSSHTPLTGATPRPRLGEALTSQIPRATASRLTQTGSSGEATHARAQIRLVLNRLSREADNLGAASPAVVLGVPADASSELVQEAAARMRARYSAMVADGGLPAEARELAAQILERVEEAARTFGKARAAAAAAVMDEERLLTLGRELIGRREWEQADRVLSRARHIKSDHPGVLANLAWARLHSGARPAETRAQEARELLMLAEQFDAQNGEGQYYLAELLYRMREYAAALPRAERAVRASPDNAAAAGLARKLRSRMSAGA